MKSKLLTSILMGTALLSASISSMAAPTPIFTEDFGSLNDGTNITTSNTAFDYVAVFGESTSSYTAHNPSGNNASLAFRTHNAGNGLGGLGISGFNEGSVFTVSMDLNITNMPGGTNLYITMGNLGATYFPSSGAFSGDSIRLDGIANNSKLYNGSLFAVKISGGQIKALTGSSNAEADWTNVGSLLSFGTNLQLHVVANGGSTQLTLNDGSTLDSGMMAIYLDSILLGTVAMSNQTTADTLRIYGHGRSASGGWDATVLLDNITLWDAAISPIPEPSTIALCSGLLVLAMVVIRRRRKN